MPPATKTKKTSNIKPLIGEELDQMFALIKDADSVELKLTVPESDTRSTLAALGMDPLDAEIRQVFFFDTPELALNKQGVVVRARRVQRKGDDSVVKLRPVVPTELPDSLRISENLVVEVDAMPGGYVCSASLKGVPGTPVRKVLQEGRPLRKLFSKEQRAFLTEHAPKDVTLDDLSVMGPIFVLKLKYRPEDFAQKVVAELWNYPDNSRIVELSTKCAPTDALRVSLESREYLRSRGVEVDSEQHTKTKTALEFFSKSLSATA